MVITKKEQIKKINIFNLDSLDIVERSHGDQIWWIFFVLILIQDQLVTLYPLLLVESPYTLPLAPCKIPLHFTPCSL